MNIHKVLLLLLFDHVSINEKYLYIQQVPKIYP
nr:MAG TPA: hypothetical protein [Bacteriophage sp.]